MNKIIVLSLSVGYFSNIIVQGDPQGWILQDGYYYYYSDPNGEKPTPPEARERCHEMSADTLSIKDEKEQWFLNTTISTGYILGLKANKDQAITRKDWYWLDGTPYDSSVWHNWETNEPNQDTSECARLFNTGGWRDQDCNYGGYPYICKKEDPCSEDNNQCVHGDCFVYHNDNLYYCECFPGYTGKNCDSNIDECSSNPCKNNGICRDAENSYPCDCTGTGYEGIHCEKDIDECGRGELVCYNNGTCINSEGSAFCKCIVGITGKICETNINECSSQPCKNEGICTDSVNDFSCNCTSAGYEGNTCEIDIDECKNGELECFYNSTCVNIPGSARCECVPGTSGNNCETNINECASNPCNNGNCIDNVNRYTCYCNPGYEGTECETDIEECSQYLKQFTCINGFCTNTVGSFICKCNDGYSESTCNATIHNSNSNNAQVPAISTVIGISLLVIFAETVFIYVRLFRKTPKLSEKHTCTIDAQSNLNYINVGDVAQSTDVYQSIDMCNQENQYESLNCKE